MSFRLDWRGGALGIAVRRTRDLTTYHVAQEGARQLQAITPRDSGFMADHIIALRPGEAYAGEQRVVVSRRSGRPSLRTARAYLAPSDTAVMLSAATYSPYVGAYRNALATVIAALPGIVEAGLKRAAAEAGLE